MFTKINFIVALAVIFTAVSVWAQDGDRIKIETNLVSVPVVVSDRDGRYVPNLTARDFTVYQDGQAQPIEFFAATEEPLTIAVLIDTSQSTRPVLDDIKDSADSFIKLLQPRDRAMVVSFDYDTHVLSPLTSSHDQLKRAVDNAEIPRDAGTVLRDAAYETITRTLAPIKGRKAVIILTDGKDAGSDISSSELFYALQETDTLVYGIQFRTEDRRVAEYALRNGHFPREKVGTSQRQSNEERKSAVAGEFMDRMARATAARFFSTDAGKLKGTFETILDKLRRQYRLGFYPPDNTPNDDRIHDVRVMVMRAGLIVRARAGYRLGTRPPETH